jgi:hypothetical protein
MTDAREMDMTAREGSTSTASLVTRTEFKCDWRECWSGENVAIPKGAVVEDRMFLENTRT